VARRVRRGFCQSWQEFAKLFEYRGTMPISGWKLIPVQSCFERVVVRSRYEYSKSIFGAEVKAKTMTSLFTLLSELVFRAVRYELKYFYLSRICQFKALSPQKSQIIEVLKYFMA
jgi:hypothetical protein